MIKKIIFIVSAYFIALSNALSASDANSLGNQEFKVTIKIFKSGVMELSAPWSEVSLEYIFKKLNEKGLSEKGMNLCLIYAGKHITSNEMKSWMKKMNNETLMIMPGKSFNVYKEDDELPYNILIPSLQINLLNRYLTSVYSENSDHYILVFRNEILETDAQLANAYKELENAPNSDKIYLKSLSPSEKNIFILDHIGQKLHSANWKLPLSCEPIDYNLNLVSQTLRSTCSLIPEKFAELIQVLTDREEKSEIFKNFYVGDFFSTMKALYGPYKGEFTIFNFHASADMEGLQVQADIDYTHIPILDNVDAFDGLLAAFEKYDVQQKIDESLIAGKKVLIACQAGVSRSATVAIIYLMKKFNLNAIQAFHVVRNGRSFIDPNTGFLQGLLKFEKNSSLNPNVPSENAELWLNALLSDNEDPFLSNYILTNSSGEWTHQEHTFNSSQKNTQFFWNLVSLFRIAGIPIVTTEVIKPSLLKITFEDDFTTVMKNFNEHIKTKKAPSI